MKWSLLPVLALAVPSPVVAQAMVAEESPTCAWESRSADRRVADVLYEKGQTLVTDGAFAEAAMAIEASAMLHPPCMEAIERLREAARLFHYRDELERARLAMIAAGERAVDLADHAVAAHAYLDAAEFAHLMDDATAAVLPIAAALELARSPALSASERAGLARRLDRGGPQKPGAGTRRAAEARGS